MINTTPWKPQLHYVWDVILDALLSPNETRSSSCDFQDFYRIAVDGMPSNNIGTRTTTKFNVSM